MDEKIKSTHLTRRATVYLRQSTMKQVLEHRESTARQYGLRERALALGWAHEQIDVVDDDLAQSATSTYARDGFQRLAENVPHGVLTRGDSLCCQIIVYMLIADTMIKSYNLLSIRRIFLLEDNHPE